MPSSRDERRRGGGHSGHSQRGNAPGLGVKEVRFQLAALDKERKKKLKALRAVEKLEKKQRAGGALEKNQQDKINRLHEFRAAHAAIEAARLEVLLRASAKARVAVGACANCSSLGHSEANCPRPKPLSAPPTRNASSRTAGSKHGARPGKPKSASSAHRLVVAGPGTRAVSAREKASEAVEVVLVKASAAAKASPVSSTDTASTHDECKGSVLVVCEKPSVALAVALALSGGRKRTRRDSKGAAPPCKLHDFFYDFRPAGGKCSVTVTSVLGHCFERDFDGETGGDPLHLFGARTALFVEEGSRKLRVPALLERAAHGADFLYLWLDCDREGENICTEVCKIFGDAGVAHFSSARAPRVFRARFSALSEVAVRRAWSKPARVDIAVATSVDVRQQLDLKIGCALTRLLTRELLHAARAATFDDGLSVVSYGPCQTPTLFFCVERDSAIRCFVPRRYWEIFVTCSWDVSDAGASEVGAGARGDGYTPVRLDWARNRCFDEQRAVAAHAACSRAAIGRIVRRSTSRSGDRATRSRGRGGGRRGRGAPRGNGGRRSGADEVLVRKVPPPAALNTVELLCACSAQLGLSPAAAMVVAERLYNAGLISYPRTESTRYDASFDAEATLLQHASHAEWGAVARAALSHRAGAGAARQGVDAGDHPPITPLRCAATPRDVPGGKLAWRVYAFVCRHFCASLSAALVYEERALAARIGPELFEAKWHELCEEGWAAALPQRLAALRLSLPEAGERRPPPGAAAVEPGARLHIAPGAHQLESEMTVPPQQLRESELVSAMDRHGIGTDASIPTHVRTVCERRYVHVCDASGTPYPSENDSNVSTVNCKPGKSVRRAATSGRGGVGGGGGRFMVPTPLGRALIAGIAAVDAGLVRPVVRAAMEAEVALVASGNADENTCLARNLSRYLSRYRALAGSTDRVRAAFIAELVSSSEGLGHFASSSGSRFEEAAACAAEAAAAAAHSKAKDVGGRLDLLSDGELRRLDEQHDVAAALSAEAERRRRARDQIMVRMEHGGVSS